MGAMVMKMQKMTNVNGKTGASGLVNAAAHSLVANVLALKLVAGPPTTSCLTPAAADSSVPDGKLKLGPARNLIAKHLQPANGEIGASGLVDAGPCLAKSMAVRHARGGLPTACRTDSAAAFSARERKLNPGTAETPKHDLCFKIVSKSFLIDQIPASMSTCQRLDTSFSNSNESKPMCILFEFSTFKINPPLFSQLSTSITNQRAEIPKKYSHVSARIK